MKSKMLLKCTLLLSLSFVIASSQSSGSSSSGLKCWKCSDANSNDECLKKGEVVTCFADQGCHNEVSHLNGRLIVNKGCQAQTKCMSEAGKSKKYWEMHCNMVGRQFGIVCHCCCFGDHCNTEPLWCKKDSTKDLSSNAVSTAIIEEETPSDKTKVVSDIVDEVEEEKEEAIPKEDVYTGIAITPKTNVEQEPDTIIQGQGWGERMLELTFYTFADWNPALADPTSQDFADMSGKILSLFSKIVTNSEVTRLIQPGSLLAEDGSYTVLGSRVLAHFESTDIDILTSFVAEMEKLASQNDIDNLNVLPYVDLYTEKQSTKRDYVDDVDECKSGVNNCHFNAKCTNTVGSYICQCNTGYEGNGVLCSDINECKNGLNSCHVNAKCINTVGSYTCECNTGYQGNGILCSDLNECNGVSNGCHVNAKCINTVGSYTCECNTGYQGNGILCSDKNECMNGLHSCNINAMCVNNIGSYTCQCNSGYQGDGIECIKLTTSDTEFTERSMEMTIYTTSQWDTSLQDTLSIEFAAMKSKVMPLVEGILEKSGVSLQQVGSLSFNDYGNTMSVTISDNKVLVNSASSDIDLLTSIVNTLENLKDETTGVSVRNFPVDFFTY